MKTVCIYHTRSGASEKIARQIAGEIGAEILTVTDGKTYNGFFGYISAAIKGLKKTLPDILPVSSDSPLEEYDRVVIIAPVWCENVSPIMRAFLAQNKGRFKGELYYVISSMSGISYLKKINDLSKLTDKPHTGVLEVKSHKNDFTAEVSAFAQRLKA